MTLHEETSFIGRLGAALRHEPLREKVLLAPTYRVGRQWLDRLALLGGGVANVRVAPLSRFVLDFAMPVLRERGLHPGRKEEKARLIAHALTGQSVDSGDGGYFTRLPANLNLALNMLSSLEEMEDASVGASPTFGAKLVSREKGDELSGLLSRYRRQKRNAGVAGPGDIGQAALHGLARSSPKPLLLVPGSVLENAGNWERRFLASWPADAVRVLEEGDTSRPDAVSFFVADHMADEVREVFRQILEAGVPLDAVEVVCVDAAAYGPVLCSVGLEIFGGRVDELPLTFNGGIPGSYAGPVRLLSAWLAWLENDLAPAGLADMVQSGLLPEMWRESAPEIDAASLAARLKALPINSGPGDYRRALGSGGEGPMRRAESWLARWLPAILPLANGGGDLDLENAEAVMRSAANLLSALRGKEGKLDAYARRALLESIESWKVLADWNGFDAVAWLGDLARSVTVMGLGPMPGCVHVSEIFNGGHSGRKKVFLVGLDDSHHPGGLRQDPVLLDKERPRISRRLAVSSARREVREKAMARLLARLEGGLTVSCAGYDVAAGRELLPAALMRQLAGDRSPETAVLRPNIRDKCLTGRDAWLWEILNTPRNTLTPASLAPWRPHLAVGEEARQARMSARFTRWDGRVPEAGEDFCREDWVFSPSQLEMLARCPMDFFFRKALGVKPPDRYEFLPGRWLRGNERGELLHDLFQDFMVRLEQAGERVDSGSHARHSVLLMEMLDKSIVRRKRRTPPRDELAYERDRRDLADACVIFLFTEITRSERGRPLCWEAALGGAAEERPPWNRVDPIGLDTISGRRILLQGRVDRIDRLNDNGGLAILDYKTGRSSGFSRSDPFKQGRHLQPLLYTEMLERVTREAGLPEPVREFSYFFPMRRDEGGVITFDREDLRGGGAIVDALVEMLATGCFPLATREEDVGNSDYLPVYGDVRELCASSRRKTAVDGALERWRELRGSDASEHDVP